MANLSFENSCHQLSPKKSFSKEQSDEATVKCVFKSLVISSTIPYRLRIGNSIATPFAITILHYMPFVLPVT